MADVKIKFRPTDETKYFNCASVKLRDGQTEAVKFTEDAPEATVNELTAKYLMDTWPHFFGGKESKGMKQPKENK